MTLRRVRPEVLIDVAASTGTVGFVGAGFLGLAAGATFLQNMLPLGQPGALTSAGTIPLINLVVAVEVAGGFVLLLSEFLEQTLVLRRPGEIT